MKKWEYLYVEAYKNDVKRIDGKLVQPEKDNLISTLNLFGDDGWEAINALPGSPTVLSNTPGYWMFLLKRSRE